MARISWLAIASAAAHFACASAQPKPVTEWYYSAWFSQSGTSSKGAFEEARSNCLEQNHIADPTAVPIGSDTERRYIGCMNAALWCNVAHPCN